MTTKENKMETTKLEIGFAPKTITLENGEFLHFWCSNSSGYNKQSYCNIVRSTTAVRATTSAKQTDILAQAKTGQWRGNVNFSKTVQKQLGL